MLHRLSVRSSLLAPSLTVACLSGCLLLVGSCAPGGTRAPSPQPSPEAATPVPRAPVAEVAEAPSLAGEVEIRRTSFGVPHILAESLESAAFGLAWVMMEDYREEVPRQLLDANGRWATVSGREGIEGDYPGRLAHDYAVEVFPSFPADVQAILTGFASGVNYFIDLHAGELPEWVAAGFSPQDVAANDLRVWNQGAVMDFIRSREAPGELFPEEEDPDVGSNAWAFGPERSRSGHAIMVRNPHLSYTSGYYEAHVTVPGVLNFYGDFRMGGPFGVIGGFNDRLGWSTTNNSGDPDQIYALSRDPGDENAYLYDGASIPIQTRSVAVEFLEADSLGRSTREFRFTPLGPVLFETPDTLFVLKTATLSQPRIGEQWLRMMQARDLDQWKSAMRIRAKYSSNFTYADADGNIFFVWNASMPILPHEPSNGEPVYAAGRKDVWTELYPWDDLPHLLNPKGGYIQNSNDPPYYTNLNEILEPEEFPANFPKPRLRFRTQNSLELVHSDRVMSLEEVVELKHSLKMILADRVKEDLVKAVRARNPTGEVAAAIEAVANWDNRTAKESRGSTLFELWASRYFATVDTASAYREPWTRDDPARTPRGLGDEVKAADDFEWAIREANTRFGSWDVMWGEVHRIRAGGLDIAVDGCPSNLGCFRTIGFAEDEDAKYRARTGDAWILAVEFGEVPRAYSVLVYGNSNQEDSPLFYNQAEMFANHTLKPVAYTEEEIQKALLVRYRPGEEQLP